MIATFLFKLPVLARSFSLSLFLCVCLSRLLFRALSLTHTFSLPPSLSFDLSVSRQTGGSCNTGLLQEWHTHKHTRTNTHAQVHTQTKTQTHTCTTSELLQCSRNQNRHAHTRILSHTHIYIFPRTLSHTHTSKPAISKPNSKSTHTQTHTHARVYSLTHTFAHAHRQSYYIEDEMEIYGKVFKRWEECDAKFEKLGGSFTLYVCMYIPYTHIGWVFFSVCVYVYIIHTHVRM